MTMNFVVPALVVPLISGSAAAYADTPRGSELTLAQTAQEFAQNRRLKAAVKEADFIFQGVVTDVAYRLSDPLSTGAVQLPYTFITYRVEKLLKGLDQKPFVTLRF